MKDLVDFLSGEDDEGEDVANQPKTSNDGEEHSLHKEGECVHPMNGRWGKLSIKSK